MKNYQNKLLALLVLFLLALSLAACQPKPQQEPGRSELTTDLLSQQPQTSVTAFFKTPDCDVLVPLVFGINSSRDTIWVALEKLLAGPPDAFVEAVIPAGIKMKDLYFADGTVHIKLTGDVPLQLSEINLQAFWSTVNMELLEQDNTTAALLIYYNDNALLSEPYTAAAVNDFGGGQAGAYVYFADPQAMYLVPLCLPVCRADFEQEADFFTALLQAWAGPPPAESGVYSTLAAVEGLELLSVSWQAEGPNAGLLTLDFSGALAGIASSAQENLLLNSLLATLAPYRQVNEVQLLANGQPLDFLPSGLEIDQPLPVGHSLDMFNRVGQ